MATITEIALFIDFGKAFDIIEWNNFNFGADIQNWVRIFYNNVTMATHQNFSLWREGFDKVALCPDCYL